MSFLGKGVIRLTKILVYGNRTILHHYEAALTAVGLRPVFTQTVPPSEDYDGLLLAGGGDLHPSFYQEEIQNCRDIQLQRDQDELALIQRFLRLRRPILGICRGIQVLNVAFGGSLCQHIPSADAHRSLPEAGDQYHPLHAKKGGFLRRLYGADFTVNSAHHQAIQKPGKGVRVIARSPDGIIEGISVGPLIHGLQFHPERMGFGHPHTPEGIRVFEFFASLCPQKPP